MFILCHTEGVQWLHGIRRDPDSLDDSVPPSLGLGCFLRAPDVGLSSSNKSSVSLRHFCGPLTEHRVATCPLRRLVCVRKAGVQANHLPSLEIGWPGEGPRVKATGIEKIEEKISTQASSVMDRLSKFVRRENASAINIFPAFYVFLNLLEK